MTKCNDSVFNGRILVTGKICCKSPESTCLISINDESIAIIYGGMYENAFGVPAQFSIQSCLDLLPSLST